MNSKTAFCGVSEMLNHYKLLKSILKGHFTKSKIHVFSLTFSAIYLPKRFLPFLRYNETKKYI